MFLSNLSIIIKYISHSAFAPYDGLCERNCTYYQFNEQEKAIDDASAGMIVAILLFVIPSKPNFWPLPKRKENGKGKNIIFP